MNGLDEEQTSPQTFLYGCMLEAGKEVVFNPEDDEFEHQLDLRMISVDPSTKDELHTVEVEGQDAEGQKVKAVLASLKPSTLPSVCLGGFWIAPPTVFRLKAGPGPVHISGQHLVMMDADQSFDEEDDECEEEEEEEEEEDVTTSKKRPASSPAIKSQKKIKMDIEEEDDDDDDDEDGDEEEADDDDDDEEEEDDEEDDDEEEDIKEEKTPVKAKPAPSKQQKPAQNGKSSKPGTPAPKPDKTPKGKGAKAKTSPSPKGNVTLPEVKAKLMEAVKKGVSLPKAQPKFENLLKQSYKVSDAKDIAELWTWRQSMKEAK